MIRSQLFRHDFAMVAWLGSLFPANVSRFAAVHISQFNSVFFLCRWNNYEIDFALECGADGVIVEGPGNPTLGSVVLELSEDEMVAKFTERRPMRGRMVSSPR